MIFIFANYPIHATKKAIFTNQIKSTIMLENFTTEQLQQQLDCANAGLNITLAATQFDLEQELCKRKQRPIIQDEQEDIDKAKAWNNFHTEQGFIPEKSY